MAKKRFEPEKPPENKGTGGPSDHGKTPLAAAINRNLAKPPEAKKRGAMIAFWKVFHLNNILIKYIHRFHQEESEEEVAHDE